MQGRLARLAGLALGNSVWSASLVFAAFKGGQALGNGLVARFSSRIERPIRPYALLEIAIGIASLLVVLGLPRVRRPGPGVRERRPDGHRVGSGDPKFCTQ